MARYTVHRTDSTQNALVAWLEARGCVYQHVGQPIDGFLFVPRTVLQRVGWAHAAVTDGRVVAVEFKSKRGTLEPAQEKFRDKWPGPFYVLRTELEAAAMLAEVQR